MICSASLVWGEVAAGEKLDKEHIAAARILAEEKLDGEELAAEDVDDEEMAEEWWLAVWEDEDDYEATIVEPKLGDDELMLQKSTQRS